MGPVAVPPNAAGGEPALGIHQLFESQARRAPSAVAAADGRRVLSYAELDDQANRLASRLVGAGIRCGTTVGVCLPHSTELAVGLLGVLKAGAACLPLDPGYPTERLQWMMADAGAVGLVTVNDPPLSVPSESVTVRLDDDGWLESSALRSHPGQVAEDTLAYVIYTSGSTGRPKGVLLPHGGLVNHQRVAVERYDLSPSDVVLQLSSIGFDISIEEMFPTWAAGGRVVFRTDDAPLSGSPFLAELERLHVTVLDLPTAFWHQWVRDLTTLGQQLPTDLRAVIVGGERANPKAYARWRELAPPDVRWFNTYGPTEASVIATLWEAPRGPSPVLDDIPLGRGIPNVALHVLDPERRPVPAGQTGELYIGGVGVAQGYLNRPELTAERFLDDPFASERGARMYRTGDLVSFADDGLLTFRGRSDDQVKIGGFRVEPGEVEAVIASHAGVAEAVAVARPSSTGEHRLVAYVLAERGAAVDGAEILRVLPERLPVHLVPSAIRVLDSFPLTANGKVDRVALPDVERATRRLATAPTGPRDVLDRALVDLWQEVLELDQVGIEDNFFELGGHSLAAVRLIGLIEWLMSAQVPLRVLLEEPTIAHLADSIRSGALQGGGGVIQPVTSEGGRPPLVYICTVETGVVALRHVLPFLSPDQPVYSFVLRRTKQLGEHGSIQDLAEIGLAELTGTLPAAAYSFLGYSFGGLVAYEMAQRLRSTGREVPLLGLLDTWAPQETTLGARLGFHRRQLRKMWSDSPRTAVGSAVRLAGARGRARLRQGGAGQSMASAPPGLPPRGAGELLLDDGSLSAMYDAYDPEPYAGRVLLITTASSVARRADEWLGWRRLAGPQWQVLEVPGTHGTVMRPEEAPFVGRALAGVLPAVPGSLV